MSEGRPVDEEEAIRAVLDHIRSKNYARYPYQYERRERAAGVLVER